MFPWRAAGTVADSVPVTRLGKWTLAPAASPIGSGPWPALLQEGLRVDLRYSSLALEEFLVAMGMIQDDFLRRSAMGDPSADYAGEQTGQSHRV
ncbi:hypothetical protein ACF06X_34275 [Streptomyces sp. NPDC015346]|uniref:hypothetical protein n=1 Tax=Streptomyces sp. NPDC015346 TaxID=3364954 RepID=UPI0036F4F67A